MRHLFCYLTLLTVLCTASIQAQHSVARQWNEVLLEAIRNDFARPTAHARNLFHVSVALYDSWATYHTSASPYFMGNRIGGYQCTWGTIQPVSDIQSAQEEAMSYAAYRLLTHRFRNSPSQSETQQRFDSLMNHLGYDINETSINFTSGPPAAVGNHIGQCLIQFGLQDGSNEAEDYANQYYQPVNEPLIPFNPGNPDLVNFNRWQPLTLDVFIDQAGNEIPFNSPPFLSPEWGRVTPFAMTASDLIIDTRGEEEEEEEYWIYHDPGRPVYLNTVDGTGDSDLYKWGFGLVAVWSSHLDPSDGVMWDISPASQGNISDLPLNVANYEDFYNFLDGGDPGIGRDTNPATGLPYESQLVPRGDFTRVLAEFWADGPDSETPPGHWFTIMNLVNDHPLLVKKFRGEGEVLDDLEWDVKSYFILGGAVHDAAVAAWSIKGWYDYIRPISAIRGMADLGQSSIPSLTNYHPGGIQIVPGLIETVETGDPLAGDNNENVGKIKLYSWRGPDYIPEPETDVAGVGWILAENWWPYQRPSFVTPPFAGYISGHSTFSRAAAEVLTLLTGDPFFPGGMGEFEIKANEFLVFEDGPSMDMTLQWATYRDASDQTSLSRIWGGIHPPVDDIPGRLIGEQIGIAAFTKAERYFEDFVTDVEDPFTTEPFKVYPNPLQTPLVLGIKIPTLKGDAVLTIINLQGKRIWTETLSRGPGRSLSIPITGITNGVYLVKLSSDQFTSGQKLLIR